MTFGCLYIPSFPAWVFERVDAAAQAAPVIVVASGEVIAFSRRLRAAGVKEGISTERAEQLVPEGTLFRRRDAQLEDAAWEDVLHEINTYTPFIEPDGTGRAFFKPFPADDIHVLSARLQAQVALAPHRATAMLAATRTAAGHVVAVRSQHVSGFLDRFEIERLAELHGCEWLGGRTPRGNSSRGVAAAGSARGMPRADSTHGMPRADLVRAVPSADWSRHIPSAGSARHGQGRCAPTGAPAFSEEILEQLPLFGFDTLGAARALAHRHLKAQFGVDGERLYRLLHPDEEDSMALYHPPPAIRRAYEFDLPCSEPGEILPVLDFIVKQAAAELHGNGAQRVKVTLHDRLRPSIFACRVLPEASSDPRRLFGTLQTLLGGMLDSGCRVQAVELELSSLRSRRPEQRSLFFERPAAAKAVEAIHRRYPDAIRRPATAPDAVFEEEKSRLETYEQEYAGGGR